MLRQIHHATRILIIATLIFCVACLLNSNLTGNGSPPILVAFHGPIMVCAFMLISAGMSAYVSDFGSALNRRFPDRGSRRLLHGCLQFGGTMLCMIGYLIHFTYNQANQISHFGTDAGTPTWKRAHVWLGLITLTGLLLQASVGLFKFVIRTRDHQAIMKWHGSLGLVVWLLGLTNVGIGMGGAFWNQNNSNGTGLNTQWVAIVSWLALAGIALATAFSVFLDPSRPASIAADGSSGQYQQFGGNGQFGGGSGGKWGGNNSGYGGGGGYDDPTFGSLYEAEAPMRGSMGSLNNGLGFGGVGGGQGGMMRSLHA